MKFISDKAKYYWKRTKEFCVYKILHADDPPHRLALGIAIGMFVTFTPLIGFQMVLSVFLAWLLGANKLVGVPLVWISNPLTIIPIYYPCYWLGCQLLNLPDEGDKWEQIRRDWMTLTAEGSVTWQARVAFWSESLLEFVWPLGIGCLIVGTVFGIVSYYASLLAIRHYRMRRWGQLMPPALTPVDAEEHAQDVSSPTSSSSDNAA